MKRDKRSFSASSSLTITAIAAVAMLSCSKEESNQGSGGATKDKDLPNDPRFSALFSNVVVIDKTAETKFAKCTYNEYKLDPATKQFSRTPEAGASVNTYTYDSQGRKTKQVYSYGTSGSTSDAITEWTYDSLGRVSKTTNSTSSGTSTYISSTCFVQYDGDSERVTNFSCYSGETADESKKNSSVEITYDLAQKTRTVTKKSLNYSTSKMKLDRKFTQQFSDESFVFAIKRSEEVYDFYGSGTSDKLTDVNTYEAVIANGVLASVNTAYFDVENNERKKSSESTCTFASGVFNCTGSSFNTAGEAYETGTAQFTPVFLKVSHADLFGCSSPRDLFCYSSSYLRNSITIDADGGFINSVKTTRVEGKLNRDGESPNRLNEFTGKYTQPYKSWMLSDTPEGTSLTVSAVGKYSQLRRTTTESQDGNVLTTIIQKRANSDTATTAEGLGDYVNGEKTSVECTRP